MVDKQNMQAEVQKKLRADREETARIMKKTSVRGIWNSIKDKYTDKGHFVYELLQNADDVGATSAKFELYLDDTDGYGKLVFRHNGTEHFFVTDPASEEMDREDNRLGSVNAITSVAQSNKTSNSIGKFGVGFKSVFHYTTSPFVYDRDFRFKIIDYIVPEFDIPDYPGRGENETVFVIPFNRPAGGPPDVDGGVPVPTRDQCYEEIRDRLVDLVFPTLFLSELSKIDYVCYDASGNIEREGNYSSQEIRTGIDGGISYSFIKYVQPENNAGCESHYLWVFSLGNNAYDRCAIAFMANEDETLQNDTEERYVQCFFPTKVKMGQRFLVHAPFLLTESREGIIENVPHNQNCINQLSDLTARSIELLAGLKTTNGACIYDDESVKVFPIRRISGDGATRFNCFFEKTKQVFLEKCVIPITRGYSTYPNVVIAASLAMRELFPAEILRTLLSQDGIDWGFPNVTMSSQIVEQSDVIKFIGEIELKKLRDKDVIDKLSKSFMQTRNLTWIAELHKWLDQDLDRREWAKKKPIFLSSAGQPVAAFDDNDGYILFLPCDGITPPPGCETLSPDLQEQEGTKGLIDQYKIAKPDAKAWLIRFIDDAAANGSREAHIVWFSKIVGKTMEMSPEVQKEIFEKLKGKKLLCTDINGRETMGLCENLYFLTPESELRNYFCGNDNILFLDYDAYLQGLPEYSDRLKAVFRSLGVGQSPRLKEVELSREDFSPEYMSIRGRWESQTWYRKEPERWIENEFEGLNDLLTRIESTMDFESRKHSAEICWRILCVIATELPDHCFSTRLCDGYHCYFRNAQKEEPFDNYLLYRLKNAKWLLDREDKPISASESTLQNLNKIFMENSVIADGVRKELGIKNDARTAALLALPPEDRKLLESARRLEQKRGKSIEELLNNDDVSGNVTESPVGDLQNDTAHATGQKPRSGERMDEEVVFELTTEQQIHLRETVLSDYGNRNWLDPFADGVSAKVVTVTDLFKMKLRIPWYQRPYEWQERNVVELLDDICAASRARKSAYRIGSIILHHHDGGYDIVDGQQRTLTLALLCSVLSDELTPACFTDLDFYPALKQCRVSRRNMRNNYVVIDKYIKAHDLTGETVRNALKILEVVVIRVETQPEAFQLFDSQNSRGRRLEPHDLLKAYHLRIAKGRPEIEKLVETWENHKSVEISRLFSDYLYRIYQWERMERCFGFTTQDIGVFKGLPVKWADQKVIVCDYDYANKAQASSGKFQIGEPVVPGLDFFVMVEHYFKMRETIREKLSSCKKIDDIQKELNGKQRGVRYAEKMFNAALLCYFDRFGFEESEPQVAIAKLFKWAYAVRLDLEYLGPNTPNKYALGGDGNYANRIALFAKIKNAREHSEITDMALNVASKEHTDNGKWGFLRDMLVEL